MASDEKDSDSHTFVDELRDIQGEYLMLSELYEKERAYGRKLAETMRMLQYEVDVTIPINKDYLSDGMNPLREAYLASESVVVMVDEDDNKTSKPLDRFSPEVILSIIQDCTPELKRLISEKRRTAALKVNSLEKVLRELRKAQATFKQTKGDVVEDDEEEQVSSGSGNNNNNNSNSSPQQVTQAPQQQQQQDQRQSVGQQKGQSRGKEKEEAYAFRASFLEKKEAAENVTKS